MLSWKFLRPITLVRSPMFLVNEMLSEFVLHVEKNNFVFLKELTCSKNSLLKDHASLQSVRAARVQKSSG